MKRILPILLLFSFIFFVPQTSSTIIDVDYENPWEEWSQPPYPEIGCNITAFTNITPSEQEMWVEITGKGVQICANITPPQGCNISVQYQWFNYTHFYDDWLDWANAQSWGYWWNWNDWYWDIDWANETDPDNSSYWHNFTGVYENINQTTQICVYNTNVSCFIENDYTREYFDWRINYSINCSGVFTNDTCNYYFLPEECEDITYIYPPSPNGTVCPCCVDLCVSVNSSTGSTMNLTFYSNLSGVWDYFYLGDDNVTLVNVNNCTYCITVPYFSLYNHTYYWNVSIDNGVEVIDSDIFQFRTAPDPSWCPSDPSELTDFIEDTCTDSIKDETWIIGVAIIFSCIPLGIIVKRRKF